MVIYMGGDWPLEFGPQQHSSQSRGNFLFRLWWSLRRCEIQFFRLFVIGD
jgi:hypothetical protein